MKALEDVRLQEITERAAMAAASLEDPTVARRYAEHAALRDVPDLLEEIRRVRAEGGGDLGQLLRDALRAQLEVKAQTEEARRIVCFGEDVRVYSLSVHYSEGKVVVDVRLLVGVGE